MTASASERNISVLEGLALKDLPEEGLSFDQALPEEWLTSVLQSPYGLRYEPVNSGRARLEVHPLGPVNQRPPVRLKGTLQAKASTDCVRCLENLEEDLLSSVDLTLFPEEQVPEGEAGMDGTYSGTVLPLPEAISEMLLLELDMNPTCRDQAACDSRTAEMLKRVNAPGERAMEEAAAAPDPRFAALKDVKLDEN